MNPRLELRGLQAVRGRRTLFSGLDVAVPAGSVLFVQGANGAGKTSLLRMLCGLLAPRHGEVLWGGQSITTLREEFGRQLIYIGHAAALKDDLTPLENLQTAAVLGGAAPTPAEAVAALAGSGLGGRERLPSRWLSQGQRRRVALARLALQPAAPLWVLDEPFNALDAAATAWLLGLIHDQAGRGGIVVLTSHQPVALDARVAQQAVRL